MPRKQKEITEVPIGRYEVNVPYLQAFCILLQNKNQVFMGLKTLLANLGNSFSLGRQ